MRNNDYNRNNLNREVSYDNRRNSNIGMYNIDPRFERYSESNNMNNNKNNIKSNGTKKKKGNKKIIVASVICLLLVLMGAIATYNVAQYEKKKEFEKAKKEAQAAAITDSQTALESYYKCIQAKDFSRL